MAWGDPENLLPVAAGTFETWVVGSDSPHGVRFTDADNGIRHDGIADYVFGLAWVDDDGAPHMGYMGQVPPSWASR